MLIRNITEITSQKCMEDPNQEAMEMVIHTESGTNILIKNDGSFPGYVHLETFLEADEKTLTTQIRVDWR